MVSFFIAGVLLVISFAFLIASYFLVKSNKYFDANKRTGKAEVVGYECSQQISLSSCLCDLQVKMPALSNKSVYLCLAGKVKASDYPIGTIVDVYYVQKTSGFRKVEIHLLDNLPKNVTIVAAMLKRIALIMFGIMLLLVMVGFIILLS